MKKTYRADDTIVNISLFIGGRSQRIAFRPSTSYMGGKRGSVFTTTSKLVQDALESNARFNNTYYLETEEAEDIQEEIKQEETPKLEQVKVESLADAKTWLEDNKGWTAKSRVTKKSLIEAASNYGIEFIGLE